MPELRVISRGWALALVFAAALVLILLLNLQLAAQFRRTEDRARDVTIVYEIRNQARTVFATRYDLESAMLSFVLTGEPAFLQAYQAGRLRIGRELQRLVLVAEGHHEVANGLPELTRLFRQDVATMDRAVALTRQGRRGEAIREVETGRGRRLARSMTAWFARADASRRTAILRQAEVAAEARRTVYLLEALLILLLAGAAWLVGRSLAVRNRSIARLGDFSRRQEAIFEAAQDGILIIRPDGTIESLNSAAASLYGFRRGDLVGQHAAELFEQPPNPSAFRDFLQSLLPGGGEDPGRVREYPARRADGSLFPADARIGPVELADGTRYVAIVRDATLRKQVDQMKTDFVSTVSHELRTPMTSIAGSLGLLAGGAAGKLPDQAARLVAIAQGNSNRLLRLIEDLLDVQKIESGRMEFHRQPVQLGPLLALAVQANRAYARDFDAKLALAPVPDDAWVVADPDKLVQVVTNLISNAAKFSPKGESVRISVARSELGHRITVADHGPGIPEDFRDHLFEKFAQADASSTRKRSGTGLGLAIVHEIVERLDGAVSFDTEIGKGTAFHVDLPAAAAPAAAARENA